MRAQPLIQMQDLVRALITSLFVGPTLILINQGNALFGEEHFQFLPALLTFFVPFLVSFSSSVLSRRSADASDKRQD
jgi:hypothetical protein